MDIFLWKIEDLTPGVDPGRRILTLAYLSKDLPLQFGVTAPTTIEELCKFSEDMRNRPWPFSTNFINTAKMVEPEEWRDMVNSDWKAEVDRIKSKDWDGRPLNIGKLNATNKKLLEAHDEIDQYPFYEVATLIKEGKI